MFSLHKALHRREQFPPFVKAQLFSEYTYTEPLLGWYCTMRMRYSAIFIFSWLDQCSEFLSSALTLLIGWQVEYLPVKTVPGIPMWNDSWKKAN